MLSPKLAHIEVVRKFGADVPLVEVYAAELNQVWTNLIDNAIDAMDGAGTLRLATSVQGGDVVIEVGDTGPGIDPDVLQRVFEGGVRHVGRTSARTPAGPTRINRYPAHTVQGGFLSRVAPVPPLWDWREPA